MANPEHLAILNQGVEVWNKWRQENPAIKPDLSDTNLSSKSLCKIDLSDSDINGTILRKVDLSNSSIRRSNLRSVILSEAKLENADLRSSNFTDSHFINAILENTNISEANLTATNLHRANLQRAVIRGARILSSDLSESNLKFTDLSYSNLRWSDLGEACLQYSKLNRTQLSNTNLIRSNLSGADITGSIIYGTSRDEWKIDGINCEYIFLDLNGKIRIPSIRDYKPGEFESLYKHLPTIEYYFENGFTPLDAILIDRVVRAISERHPDFELKLDSFHSRGQPHAVFTVLHKEVAEAALNQIKAGYEARIAKLEGERDALERCVNRVIDEPRTIIKRIEMGDTYEIKSQAGAVGPGASAHDLNFSQAWNDISKDVDLSRLSEDLLTLKEALAREAKSSDEIRALAEVSDAETASKTDKGSKVVEHLKKAGKWAFDMATNIGTDVAAEVIKKSMGP